MTHTHNVELTNVWHPNKQTTTTFDPRLCFQKSPFLNDLKAPTFEVLFTKNSMVNTHINLIPYVKDMLFSKMTRN